MPEKEAQIHSCHNCDNGQPGYFTICATTCPPRDENGNCGWWKPIQEGM